MFFGQTRKPAIKKVSVPIADARPARSTPQPSAISRKQSPALSDSKRRSLTPTALARVAKPSRLGETLTLPSKPRAVERSPGGRKRKPASPASFAFVSDKEESDDDQDSIYHSDASGARKRQRTSGSEELDQKRVLEEKTDWTNQRADFIHSLAVTQGNTRVYTKAFKVEGPVPARVELAWPTGAPRETYELVIHTDTKLDNDDYSPILELIDSVEQTLRNFFPESEHATLFDDNNGFIRRLKRAMNKISLPEFVSVVSDYNRLVDDAVASGVISKTLAEKHSLPFPLVQRIIYQIHTRTVSPHVHLLHAYKNGTSEVYGELLPKLVDSILTETNCSSKSVFLDLGSGVGNVVLQAALQTGAESWGIEMMKNPSSLAAKQLKEFNIRCRAWGLRVGRARLLQGDFLKSPEVDSLLKRADIILVNNHQFDALLNDALLLKFLDLKEGTRIVSLRSFVPDNFQVCDRTVNDPRCLLSVQKFEYFSDCVSWGSTEGQWFIATKDSSKLRNFQEQQMKALARSRRSA